MDDSISEGEIRDDSSSVIYDDQEEPAGDYKVGGYHPLNAGEVLFNRYLILQKVGWGHFSTVWLSQDLKHNTFVALKIQKSAAHYTEAAYDEIDMLLKVSSSYRDPAWVESLKERLDDDLKPSRDHCYVVQLLNSFMHEGPHGKHVCMVFEILGVNLLEIIKAFNYKGVPIPICRTISRQILIGLDYMHRICGLIHTDLKPENVLVELTQAQMKEVISLKLLNTRIDKEIPPATVEEKKIVQTDTQQSKTKEQSVNLEEPSEQPKPKREQQQQQEKLPPASSKAQKKRKYRERKRQQKKDAMQNQMDEDNIESKVEQEIEEKTEQPPKKKRKRNRKKKEKLEDETEIQEKIPKTESAEKAKLRNNEQQQQEDFFQEQTKEEPINLDPVNEFIRVKIADLGNACWIHNHFTPQIQTRQYRSPEVILGITYGPSADIWSFACMMFQLLTGDFLFDPQSNSGFDKEEDHLAQMVETLGFFPQHFSLCGSQSKKYFDNRRNLRHIRDLRIWPLKNVLMEKYRIKESESAALCDFLLPLLVYEPEKRCTAKEALKHYWLDMPSNYEYRMTEKEFWQNSLKQGSRELENNDRIKRGDSPVYEGIRMPSSDEDCDIEDNIEYAPESSSASDKDVYFQENVDYHNEMIRFKEDTERIHHQSILFVG